MYRATINLDFTGGNTNELSRLTCALEHANWIHVETSAFVRESVDIADMWRGIELVSKQANAIEILSAFTFHIQYSNDFTRSIPNTSTYNHQNAFDTIRALPFP